MFAVLKCIENYMLVIKSDWSSNKQKKTENCINAHRVLLQFRLLFFFGWYVDQPKKNIRFISLQICILHTQITK